MRSFRAYSHSDYYMCELTLFEAERIVVPVGINAIPIPRNIIITFKGVMTGCHDVSFC